MRNADRCTWLVEVRCVCSPDYLASPDFEGCYCEGLYVVDCGAPVTTEGQGWRCDAGHEHRGLEIELAIDALSDQAQRAGMNADDADRFARGVF